MSKIDINFYMNLYEKIGNYQEAILEYEKEIVKNPYNDIFYYRICFSAFEIHNKKIYDFWYGKYIKLFSGLSQSSQIFKYLKIFSCYFNGDINSIKIIIDDLGMDIPEEIVGMRIGIFLYQGEYDNAIKLGKQCKIYSWVIYYYIASGFFLKGNYLESYKVLSNFGDEYPYIYDLKLKVLKKLGKKYIGEFNEKKNNLKNTDFSVIDYNALANSYFTVGETRKSLYYYLCTLKNFPHDVYSYNGIGNCYVSLGQYEQGRKFYLLGLSKNHGIFTSYSYIGIAKTYMLQGDYKKSYKILLGLINAGVKNPTLYFEISRTCFLGNIYNKNIPTYLDSAISMNEKYGAAIRLKKKLI